MLQLDASMSNDLDDTAAEARRIEADGFRTAWIGESKYDPFLRCYAVGAATERLQVGTSIAIAFGRSPLTVASSAYDLARYSRGRFTLGLGSQVKAHIERRFSMPWSHPAARMREFISALRAIWQAWQEDGPLRFEGEFYTHTLMPPFFRPEAHSYGPPPVFLAAVGELMTEVAGEVADGVFFHPFTTERYLREVTLPALTRGRQTSGKSLDGFAVCGPVLTATGRTEEELATAIAGVRAQIAFYASTPAYRPVLALHGWEPVGVELTALTKQDRWKEMSGLIDDDMLQAFAVVGRPSEVARTLDARFGAIARSVSFSAPYEHDRSVWLDVAGELGSLTRPGA